MIAVASEDALYRLALRSLARVRDAASAQEARSLQSDEGVLGEGLTQAVMRATQSLSPPREIITDLYGDINGERHRTDDWGFTLLRASSLFQDGSAYYTAVSQCGDLGAATGAFGCALAVQAWQRRYAKGPRALVWAGSWSGLRAAALLEQGEV
jgi:3-oxoacyl-[acyl-carrier-protein] synthase-1